MGLDINIDFSLSGESTCYIFSRTTPKEDSLINDTSTIIRINKEDKCQKCFVSLSTFTESNGILVYKTFSKRQLVNISSKLNFYSENKQEYYEQDKCDFSVHIYDSGEEKLVVKVSVNDCKTENEISADYYLPTFDSSYVMIGSIGQSCIVKNCLIKPFHKIKTQFSTDRRNCECCNIF
jgi:hypothetical protein